MSSRVSALYRYPVKGLSAEPLTTAQLLPGQGLALDRQFALAHADTVFDPENPQHLPKTRFVMRMKNEQLAAIESRYSAETGELHLYQQGKCLAQGNLSTAQGRRQIELFFKDYLADVIADTPKLVQSLGHMFSDVADKVLSFINLASVRALEEVLGESIDPLRFRANVYIDGLPAWAELAWSGKDIQIADTHLRGLKPTKRCAATNVNPDTAQRDMNIPKALVKHYGHANLGMYMQVIRGGIIKPGNEIKDLL
ncbi:MOSC domain-containing protein [Candidatus Venteria ishoeyi]|uniref:MOSC domain protein n=1 Tax=Candidatus Venteria ishoeyi TaxID=1899563 RepID=A0A1H6FF16_9GAMM|nr:MOSC domain-containing protein [Candidatus Venteria ishoeyi]MDM8546145.1 MOSC domain-containing protein [Candidatus Venteria ishoeyi]SEH08011.1 MOSC domain protein [Candidatus Venteria ishoeyi]